MMLSATPKTMLRARVRAGASANVSVAPLNRRQRAAGLVILALAGAIVLSPLASAVPPVPNAPLPRDAGGIAAALSTVSQRVDAEIAAWRSSRAKGVPEELTLDALYQQRLLRLLSRNDRLAQRTLPLLPRRLASFARDVVVAHRELARLTPRQRADAIRVGGAAPAAKLLAYYRAAQGRFGVPWNLLAAVNFVESAFGKLRSASAAGAQGPMQFMPATWRTYGLGGNVHDSHDAILGAANYLHASGAPRDLRRALHAYNPSPSYVDAVLRYARGIRTDVHAFYWFYCWQVFARTTRGERRLTGPGLH
jgi:membrane-bound lytic murein transglycosylase B